jgi:hypothetical protein
VCEWHRNEKGNADEKRFHGDRCVNGIEMKKGTLMKSVFPDIDVRMVQKGRKGATENEHE